MQETLLYLCKLAISLCHFGDGVELCNDGYNGAHHARHFAFRPQQMHCMEWLVTSTAPVPGEPLSIRYAQPHVTMHQALTRMIVLSFDYLKKLWTLFPLAPPSGRAAAGPVLGA